MVRVTDHDRLIKIEVGMENVTEKLQSGNSRFNKIEASIEGLRSDVDYRVRALEKYQWIRRGERAIIAVVVSALTSFAIIYFTR